MFFFIDFVKLIQLLTYDPYDPLFFSSALFMFLFFFLIIIYRISSPLKVLRVLVLISFSFFFYYKSNGLYFLLLLLVAVVNYSSALMLYKSAGVTRRILFVSGIAANLFLLGYFKYTPFFTEIINNLFVQDFSFGDLFLPIGISFFIFKAISYLTDVNREMIEPERNFLDFTLYISFFGNVLAGPIDRASAFLPQIKKEYFVSKQQLSAGVLLIISGLFKKVVIADYISINFVDRVFEFPTRFSGVENLLAVYGYTLQVYCDFSGYTDLAIGISLLLGFHLMENFNYPYRAKSIADFWRRWHISLSSWLLDYLFRPLQMNFRNMRLIGNIAALLITFILCGFWHGAGWTFIFWGFLHGFFMSFSLATAKPRKILFDKLGLTDSRILPFFQVVFTFHLVAFSWIFFRAPSFEYAANMLDQISSYFHPEIFFQFISGYPSVTFLIILGYLLHFIPKSFEIIAINFLSKRSLFIHAALLAIMIWLAAQVKSSEIQPFLYFQF
jgi:alginate O-acetyltransferase complex protein AlgI